MHKTTSQLNESISTKHRFAPFRPTGHLLGGRSSFSEEILHGVTLRLHDNLRRYATSLSYFVWRPVPVQSLSAGA